MKSFLVRVERPLHVSCSHTCVHVVGAWCPLQKLQLQLHSQDHVAVVLCVCSKHTKCNMPHDHVNLLWSFCLDLTHPTGTCGLLSSEGSSKHSRL